MNNKLFGITLTCLFVSSCVMLTPSYKQPAAANSPSVTFSIKDPSNTTESFNGMNISACSAGKLWDVPPGVSPHWTMTDKFTKKFRANERVTIRFQNNSGGDYGAYQMIYSCYPLFTFTPQENKKYHVWGSTNEEGCRLHIAEQTESGFQEIESDFPHEEICYNN